MSGKNSQVRGFWNVVVPATDHGKVVHHLRTQSLDIHDFAANAVRNYVAAGYPKLPDADSTEPARKFYGAVFLPLALVKEIEGKAAVKNVACVLDNAMQFAARDLPDVVHAPVTPHVAAGMKGLVAAAGKVIGTRGRTAARAIGITFEG